MFVFALRACVRAISARGLLVLTSVPLCTLHGKVILLPLSLQGIIVSHLLLMRRGTFCFVVSCALEGRTLWGPRAGLPPFVICELLQLLSSVRWLKVAILIGASCLVLM